MNNSFSEHTERVISIIERQIAHAISFEEKETTIRCEVNKSEMIYIKNHFFDNIKVNVTFIDNDDATGDFDKICIIVWKDIKNVVPQQKTVEVAKTVEAPKPNTGVGVSIFRRRK